MALVGKPSTAHEYDKNGQCVHCRMYKSAVEKLVHVCTQQREIEADGVWLREQVAPNG